MNYLTWNVAFGSFLSLERCQSRRGRLEESNRAPWNRSFGLEVSDQFVSSGLAPNGHISATRRNQRTGYSPRGTRDARSKQ
ncbi:MAG: hypothetical protein QOF74_8481 [Caballeronia mineralivorans]|nr:hypothetical protein [Caballeronia mineralivorans]